MPTVGLFFGDVLEVGHESGPQLEGTRDSGLRVA
jgi:hypothetical protein